MFYVLACQIFKPPRVIREYLTHRSILTLREFDTLPWTLLTQLEL
jgi:hypothetical protein